MSPIEVEQLALGGKNMQNSIEEEQKIVDMFGSVENKSVKDISFTYTENIIANKRNERGESIYNQSSLKPLETSPKNDSSIDKQLSEMKIIHIEFPADES